MAGHSCLRKGREAAAAAGGPSQQSLVRLSFMWTSISAVWDAPILMFSLSWVLIPLILRRGGESGPKALCGRTTDGIISVKFEK